VIFEKGGIKLETVIDTIKSQGLCIIKDWFTNEQAELLKQEQLLAYSQFGDNIRKIFPNQQESFRQGKAMAILPNSYGLFPSLQEIVLSDSYLNDVVHSYYNNNCKKFLQIFCTYENKVVSKDNLGRASHLHVDPYAAFKIAFFPFGAKKSNGALRVIPGSREEGANIRINFMSKNPKGLDGGIAHTIKEFNEQCPELVTRNEEEAVYMECSSTDICLIDTDTYHGGGLIEEKGKERLAVYIHSRP